MRNLYLISFTKAGKATAGRIAGAFHSDSEWTVHTERTGSLGDFVASIFKPNNALVFVGAVGIAVRCVAPLLRSKRTDPPVIVVDEAGRHVIPILSGHVGGANRLAKKIATKIGGVPVLTTATDIHGVFAVDLFAVENGYVIVDPEMVKTVSARLLDGQSVGLFTDLKITGPLPENIVLREYGEVGIFIGTEPQKSPFEKTLSLAPKCYHVGIGCRKGVAFGHLHDFFLETLKSQSIPVQWVGTLSSLVLKKDEQAIRLLAHRYGIPFKTYSQAELQEFESLFECSEFVRSQTGVGNVCEISAWLSSNQGEIVLKKTVQPGMTLAVAKEDWKVRFDLSESENREVSE